MFEFCVYLELGGVVEGILRYYLFFYDRETYFFFDGEFLGKFDEMLFFYFVILNVSKDKFVKKKKCIV